MQVELAQEANVGSPKAMFTAYIAINNTRDFILMVNDFKWMVVERVLNVLVISIVFYEI